MNPDEKRKLIFARIADERQRQIKKWGHLERRVENPEADLFWKGAVLGEEMGEVHKALVEQHNLELEKELVQVAAVAVAWLESL